LAGSASAVGQLLDQKLDSLLSALIPSRGSAGEEAR
jgi:hypothetical protein